MTTEIFQIDTKGTCLLCFSDCGNLAYRHRVGPSSTAFKMLLRYLKIDIMQLAPFSSPFNPLPSGSGSEDISVLLCSSCSTITTDFLQLFRDFEWIRMGLDNCAQKLHHVIEKGEKDGKRVQEYRNRVNTSRSSYIRPLDALNANIAESLRTATREKCAMRAANSTPRIMAIGDEALLAKVRRFSTTREVEKRMTSGKKPSSFVTMLIPEVNAPPIVNVSTLKCDPLDVFNTFEMETADSMETTMMQTSTTGGGDTFLETYQAATEESSDTTTTPISSCILCTHCQTSCSSKFKLREHLIMCHPFIYYSNGIPEDVQELDFQSALLGLVRKRSIVQCSTGRPSYGCPVCSKPFRDTYILKRHVLAIHLKEVLKVVRSNDDDNDNVHLENSSTPSQTVDPHLVKVDVDPDSLMEVGEYEDESFSHQENQDTEELSNHSSFANEHNQDEEENPEQTAKRECPHCKKMFCHELSLQMHIREFHTGQRVPHQCTRCHKSFARQSALRYHEADFHTFEMNVDKFPPGTTEEQFEKAVRKILKQMREIAVGRDEGTPKTTSYGCHLCYKVFARKDGVKWHVLLDHLEQVVASVAQGYGSAELAN